MNLVFATNSYPIFIPEICKRVLKKRNPQTEVNLVFVHFILQFMRLSNQVKFQQYVYIFDSVKKQKLLCSHGKQVFCIIIPYKLKLSGQYNQFYQKF